MQNQYHLEIQETQLKLRLDSKRQQNVESPCLMVGFLNDFLQQLPVFQIESRNRNLSKQSDLRTLKVNYCKTVCLYE